MMDDDLGPMMSTGLHERASLVDRAPLDLEGVRRRARQIRRRRRGAVVAAAAILVAVAVPTGLLLGGDHDRGDAEPAGPPTSGATRASDTGGDPTLPWLFERSLQSDQGTLMQIGVTSRGLQSFTVLADGRVVAVFASRGAQATVHVLSQDGSEQGSYDLGPVSLRSSPDRSLAAWVDADGRPQVLESGVDQPVALAPLPGRSQGFASVVGVGGSGCADGGCRVWSALGDGTTVVSGDQASTDVEVPAGVQVSDVYAPTGEVERMAGEEVPPGGASEPGCAVLLDPDGARTARSCDTADPHFSPDGRLLLGGRVEGYGAASVDVLDLDLLTVTTLRADGALLAQTAFDSDGSLLSVIGTTTDDMSTRDTRQWSVVRWSVDAPTDPDVVSGPFESGVLPGIYRLPV